LSSSGADLLIALTRDSSATLQSQIERQILAAVRSGSLRPGTALPSTRELALELGVSRPIVVDAYAQLGAEGYLTLRQGARPRIAATAQPVKAATIVPTPDAEPMRYDFRPGVPDLSSFPKSEWLKASHAALAKMTAADFGYSDRYGSKVLREALADYLGRVRGVVADPEQVMITSGFEQGRAFTARALARLGVKKIAVESPGYSDWHALTDAGLELIPIEVDEHGLQTDVLERSEAQAIMVTPAHQYPSGVVMSGERRLALVAWLRAKDAFAVEDDYDAEFRYDRAPVGALQGLDPEHVVYAGTASKTLAPALRLGWLVVPDRLLEAVRWEQQVADYGCSRTEQHALAELIARGDFDRHLRRMRGVYRDRREALLSALAEELPEATIGGVAAGLHATVRLPECRNEAAIRAAAARRSVGLEFISRHYITQPNAPTTLLLGYARGPESSIRTGIRALAAALREG